MKRLLALLALTACSGGTSFAPISGLPFTPNSELALQGAPVLPDGGVDTRFAFVSIAQFDQGSVDCASLSDGQTRTGQLLGILMGPSDGGPLPIGTYPVVADPTSLDSGVGALLVVVDSSGNKLAVGHSGTVSLSSVGSSYVGTLNVEVFVLTGGVENGQTATYAGDFSAEACSL